MLMIQFIHAADLHLDSPFKGLRRIPKELLSTIKQATFDALTKIVDEAISHQVDFLLISGDIYDVEDRSIKAQVVLKRELERLIPHNIHVFIIHGNHDYQTSQQDHLALPENTHVFPNTVETIETTTKTGKRVAITGFSYDKKWIEERKISEYPTRHPQVDYHIGLLHGYAEGQQTDHARYAPFSINELRQKQYDYWALGHIHKFQQLASDPLIYYSGNPQGRHRKEEGEKGCLLVELNEPNKQVTFLPTAQVIWTNIDVDLTEKTTLNSIFEAVKEAVSQDENTFSLITLHLTVSNDLPSSVIKKLEQLDFYEALQLYSEQSFHYIVESKVSVQAGENEVVSLKKVFPTAWETAIEEMKKSKAFNIETDELYNSYVHSKYLNPRDDRYRNEIVERAMNLLLQDLGDKEGAEYED